MTDYIDDVISYLRKRSHIEIEFNPDSQRETEIQTEKRFDHAREMQASR